MPARRPARAGSRAALVLVSVLVALLGSTLLTPAAGAAEGDAGFPGPSTAGSSTTVGTALTAEKPESKLWWNDGRWWASMWEAGSAQWQIAYLDRSRVPEAWVFTGKELDDRASSRADVLWNGSKLYVASHVKAADSTSHVAKPARLYRYSYDPATRAYTLDSGFPAVINGLSSETLVLDQDSSGRLWATYTQDGAVYVNTTAVGDDTAWGTPFLLPVDGASDLTADDISTLVEFRGQIGVMWSNQARSAVLFATHAPADPATTWSPSTVVTVPGSGQADDHLDIKSLQGDSTGRIFAVIKTSLDSQGPDAPAIVVLARSATGEWSRATFGTFGDCHTRPIVMLDGTNALMHVYATAPDSGCAYTGSNGTIFEKTSPLDALSFAPGRGTPVMRDALSPHLNNVTGSKQTVTSTTGIVLLASNDEAQRYWSSDQPLGTPAPPAPTPTATPTVQTVTVPVQVDTYVSSTAPKTNYGHASVLDVDGSPVFVSYLKFNLSSYAGRKVTRAVLRLGVGSNGSTGSQTVRAVANDSWTETGTTYSNKPARGSAIGTLGATSVSRSYDVPLSVPAVQGELGSTMSLALDSTSSDGVLLAAREAGPAARLVLTLG